MRMEVNKIFNESSMLEKKLLDSLKRAIDFKIRSSAGFGCLY
jgi:hypothetical protein